MSIQFDHAHLLAEAVGPEHGLKPDEIKHATPAAREALQRFQKASEAGTYGFPHLPFQKNPIKAITAFAKQREGAYDTVCVVGIGGSALGTWALDCALHGPHPVQPGKHPRLVMLDNVDPSFVEDALSSMSPKRTQVVVVAKSGSTAETVATFLIVRAWLEGKLGRKASKHISVVTSEGKGDLFALASREGYPMFYLPDNVGGRFSVLSAVALLPAALAGMNVNRIVKGAAEITHSCWQSSLEENPALRSALLHYLIWTTRGKTIQVAFPYSNRLWGTAFWFRQLWAESLGKARSRNGELVNLGQTPVAALGTTDQHSQVQLYIEGPNDKVFTFWAVRNYGAVGKIPKEKSGLDSFDYLGGQTLAKLIDAERRSTATALAENQRPNCTFTLSRVDEEHIGAFLQLMEFQTAFLGEMLDIDAFNQEGVELGKKLTFGLMGRKGYEEYAKRVVA